MNSFEEFEFLQGVDFDGSDIKHLDVFNDLPPATLNDGFERAKKIYKSIKNDATLFNTVVCFNTNGYVKFQYIASAVIPVADWHDDPKHGLYVRKSRQVRKKDSQNIALFDQQWVSNVLYFTREYGGSWAATNLIGAPQVYPRHGDIRGAFTWGFTDQRENVIIEYTTPMLVTNMNILETNIPGSIVKIECIIEPLPFNSIDEDLFPGKAIYGPKKDDDKIEISKKAFFDDLASKKIKKKVDKDKVINEANLKLNYNVKPEEIKELIKDEEGEPFIDGRGIWITIFNAPSENHKIGKVNTGVSRVFSPSFHYSLFYAKTFRITVLNLPSQYYEIDSIQLCGYRLKFPNSVKEDDLILRTSLSITNDISAVVVEKNEISIIDQNDKEIGRLKNNISKSSSSSTISKISPNINNNNHNNNHNNSAIYGIKKLGENYLVAVTCDGLIQIFDFKLKTLITSLQIDATIFCVDAFIPYLCPISRYNDEYYCYFNFPKFSKIKNCLRFAFCVLCDNSLGRLQDPTSSTIVFNEYRLNPSFYYYSKSDPNSTYEGFLEYQLTKEQVTSFENSSSISISYGSSGYSTVSFPLYANYLSNNIVEDEMKNSKEVIVKSDFLFCPPVIVVGCFDETIKFFNFVNNKDIIYNFKIDSAAQSVYTLSHFGVNGNNFPRFLISGNENNSMTLYNYNINSAQHSKLVTANQSINVHHSSVTKLNVVYSFVGNQPVYSLISYSKTGNKSAFTLAVNSENTDNGYKDIVAMTEMNAEKSTYIESISSCHIVEFGKDGKPRLRITKEKINDEELKKLIDVSITESSVEKLKTSLEKFDINNLRNLSIAVVDTTKSATTQYTTAPNINPSSVAAMQAIISHIDTSKSLKHVSLLNLNIEKLPSNLLSKLESIDLSTCNFDDFELESITDNKKRQGKPLLIINNNNNPIVSFIINMLNLPNAVVVDKTIVTLNNSNFTRIPPFLKYFASTIRSLDLSSNKLSKLSNNFVQEFVVLEKLDLSKNEAITDIDQILQILKLIPSITSINLVGK
jgi:hypothetical protein